MKILTSIFTLLVFWSGCSSAEEKVVEIKCIAGLKYDVKEINAKVGEKIKLNFSNPDVMPHNIVVVKPGSEQKVAQAALKMGSEGMAKGFIPKTDDIIAHSKLLQKDGKEVIEVSFDKAGSYPYICTFPGHSVIMKGVIIVK